MHVALKRTSPKQPELFKMGTNKESYWRWPKKFWNLSGAYRYQRVGPNEDMEKARLTIFKDHVEKRSLVLHFFVVKIFIDAFLIKQNNTMET